MLTKGEEISVLYHMGGECKRDHSINLVHRLWSRMSPQPPFGLIFFAASQVADVALPIFRDLGYSFCSLAMTSFFMGPVLDSGLHLAPFPL